MTVTSDFRPEVEIWLFCACAIKNMHYSPYLWTTFSHLIIIIIQKFITRAQSHIKHESEAWASHPVARRSVLIVNELGYEMRLQVALETI